MPPNTTVLVRATDWGFTTKFATRISQTVVSPDVVVAANVEIGTLKWLAEVLV